MPAIALLGPRQVGKTTVAKQFASHQSALYLDLESAEDLFKLSAPADFLRQHNDKLIILDEIQRMPNLFTVLQVLKLIYSFKSMQKNDGPLKLNMALHLK